LSRSTAVITALRLFATQKVFLLATIKRTQDLYVATTDAPSAAAAGFSKPHGMDVESMYDAALFVCGTVPVTDSPLNPEEFVKHHREVCSLCAACPPTPLGLDLDCYFYGMYLCLVFGWAPPVDTASIRPQYSVDGNYRAVEQFLASTQAEISDMLANGVISPAPPGTEGIEHPLGIVIKNSDRAKAAILALVPSICDDASLKLASERMQGLAPLPDGSYLPNYGKVKARGTVDPSATGVNKAAYSPPFSYPGIAAVARIITPNCVMGKCDIGRYFFSYPLAYSSRWMFLFRFLGVLYIFARLFFGFTACPYYCSTFSSEIQRWCIGKGLAAAHMVDDFIVAHPSEEGARDGIRIIIGMLVACGFTINPDKSAFGRELVFLGFLWSSITMTVRFDAVQAMAFHAELEAFKASILKGDRVSHTTVRHIAGKLNWFSEVLQSGRLHIRAFWLYLKHGRSLSTLWQGRLLRSIDWWLQKTQAWGSNEGTGTEYKLFSADFIAENMSSSVLLMQSDASGTDGYGWLASPLGTEGDDQSHFRSRAWGLQGLPPHSFYAELVALHDYLHDGDVNTEGKLLLWVTDSLSAVHAINRGRCKDEATFALLESIFDALDAHHCQILALFVPREANEAADYLSHLSTILCRSTVAGPLSDLDLHRAAAAQGRAL
jgi:hypothetical protein